MWCADIYCDLAWVAERQGALGPPRFTLRGARSSSLGFGIELLLFGDDYQVRHVRVLMHTDSRDDADRCVDLNIQTWVASLEATLIMETGRPFHVAQLPGPQQFVSSLGEGDGTSPAAVLVPEEVEPQALNYERIARGIGAWGSGASEHLFYFRRFVDDSFPLDVRWLNGYRLLEWHFVRRNNGRGELQKSPQWRAFLEEFREPLAPALRRPSQSLSGLMEDARALAAHAGVDKRPEQERVLDPQNAMEKTFHALGEMVIAIINRLPSAATAGIAFGRRQHSVTNTSQMNGEHE